MKRDFSNLTSVKKALEKIFEALKEKPLKLEGIPVYEAYGRVLGEDIISSVDLPPFPSALMDGYAVRAEDTAKASEDNPVKLRIVGAAVLGKRTNLKIEAGEACYVPTGSFLPRGADAVVKVEDVKTLNQNLIAISKEIKPGSYVSPAGEDVKRGETLLRKGHILNARDIGILTALRIKEVKVVMKPVVAVFSTGDELVDYHHLILDAEKIIDTHRLMIVQMLRENGSIPYELGIAPDDPDRIVEKLREGLAKADLILTIGGCSQGEKDYVPEAINSLGKPGVIVHGVAIKPGRVTGLAVVDGKPIVILPGLPQSTIVGFILFALPLLRSMLGLSKALPYFSVNAKMKEEVRLIRGIRQFIFVELEKTSEGFFAAPLIGESNLLSNIIKADGFIITTEDATKIEEGQKVSVFLFKTN
ncbi:TPA: molybdopterin molybdotransferase MoeA [Candidatus Bathyarchaeota archaeon]|nr:molybdopterin molybdotransferase MoeA [Candidatus Bathyarchaeota archaeon]